MRAVYLSVAALLVAMGSPTAAQAQSSAIEQGSLAELDPWAVGAPARGEAALPRTLWRQSDPAALELAFDRVPPTIGSPTALRLTRQALLSPAEQPSGVAVVAARKRYEALARIGAGEEIASMVSGSGEAKRDPAIALYATQGDLGRGRLREACRRADLIQTDAPPPFVLRLRVLCFAEAGERESADLAMEVARVTNAADPTLPWFQGAVAVLNGAPPARPPLARYDTSLNAATSIAAKLRPPPQNALVNASTFALAIVARSETAPAGLRAQAAAKALRMAAIPADVARAAGRVDALEKTPTPLGLSVKEVEAAAGPYAQALAIDVALKRAKPHGEFTAMARLFAPDIARLPIDPGTAPAAATFARALMAIGDHRAALAWRRSADTVPADPALLGILDLALTIAADDAAAARFAAERRIDTAAARTDGLAARDLTALQALGYDIGETARAFVARTPPALGRKPDPSLMMLMTTAAQRGAAGEVALHAALAIGDGAEQLDAASLAQILGALRAVGLAEPARHAALEAVVAGQAR
ncbi:MAG: hypothetical protein NW200_09140 [Hyphomonadaceae bacterium]|nr:hypothetical protein [Hyphomonadaceae bacterium]